jgi:hypothetical protein
MAITVASGNKRKLSKNVNIEHTANKPRTPCAQGRRVRKADQPPLRSTHGASKTSTIAERAAINTGIDNCDTACLDKASITDSKNTPATIQAMPCSGWSARTGASDGGVIGSFDWKAVNVGQNRAALQASALYLVQFTALVTKGQSPALPTGSVGA